MSDGSPWLAVDPEGTDERRVPDRPDGLLVSFGFWPPKIENKLRARLRSVRIFGGAEAATSDDLEAQYQHDDDLLAEAVRWSVRGWDGEPAAVLEEEMIGGRVYKKLSAASIDRVRRNGLLPEMAIAAASFNVTSQQGKGGSGAS